MFRKQIFNEDEYEQLKKFVVENGLCPNGDKCAIVDVLKENTWLSLVMCFSDNFKRINICSVMTNDNEEIQLTTEELHKCIEWLTFMSTNEIYGNNRNYEFYQDIIEPSVDCPNLKIKMII